MDSFREHPSDFDLPSAAETPPASDVAAAIGTDERRMHVRAYNYWVSLLDGRDFPSIEDLEPADVEDFSGNSVLLDFTCGRDNPAIPYVGGAIRDECGLDDDMRTIGQVPSRSLLSRLTDHYMQIIANRAPVGFEAEFDNQRGETICYRGILMPFSSDGDAIDFIYGVINWKKVGESFDQEPVSAQLDDAAVDPEPSALELTEAVGEAFDEEPVPAPIDEAAAEAEADALDLTEEPGDADDFIPEIAGIDGPAEPVAEDHVGWEDGPSTEPVAPVSDFSGEEPAPLPHFSWQDGPLSDEDGVPEVELDEDAGLADRLWAARETAEAVKSADGRTRVALYSALSMAYDFAIAAQSNPDEYSELLEESGVKAQARAPMTPIVKLVFGIDYDKARLTEFAAALSYAQRQQIAPGGFKDFIEKQAGGLKALVAAEREARRPEPKADTKGEVARAKLRLAPAMSLAEIASDDEFAVVVTRRGSDGSHEPVGVLDDPALIEKAIRKVA